jgi:hypothetical protein
MSYPTEIIYKIYHLPTRKYIQSLMDYGNIKNYGSKYADIKLGQKGKSWKTKQGVVMIYNYDLKLNCQHLNYKLNEFEIHELIIKVQTVLIQK